MPKLRNIPDNMKPFWECTVNGVKYSYLAGAEDVTVPNAVAAVIDNYNAMLPKENPPETDEQMAVRVAEGVAEGVVAGLMLDITSLSLSDTPITCSSFSVKDFDAVVASKYHKPITAKYKIDGVISTVGDYQVKYTVVEGAVTDPVITFPTVADGESRVESIGELQFTKGTVGSAPTVYVAFVAATAEIVYADRLATASKPGLVKKAAYVESVTGDTPTKDEFNGLVDKLMVAGIIKATD